MQPLACSAPAHLLCSDSGIKCFQVVFDKQPSSNDDCIQPGEIQHEETYYARQSLVQLIASDQVRAYPKAAVSDRLQTTLYVTAAEVTAAEARKWRNAKFHSFLLAADCLAEIKNVPRGSDVDP